MRVVVAFGAHQMQLREGLQMKLTRQASFVNWMVGGGGGWSSGTQLRFVVGLTGCMGSGCLKDPSLKKKVMNSVWGW